MGSERQVSWNETTITKNIFLGAGLWDSSGQKQEAFRKDKQNTWDIAHSIQNCTREI